MRNRPFTLAYGVMVMLGMACPAVGQDNGIQQPSARQQLQHIHAPQSIDQELAHPDERSGIDSGTAAVGPASATGAPR